MLSYTPPSFPSPVNFALNSLDLDLIRPLTLIPTSSSPFFSAYVSICLPIPVILSITLTTRRSQLIGFRLHKFLVRQCTSFKTLTRSNSTRNFICVFFSKMEPSKSKAAITFPSFISILKASLGQHAVLVKIRIYQIGQSQYNELDTPLNIDQLLHEITQP